MNHDPKSPERGADPERQAERTVRHEQVVWQYRRDHPKFNQHVVDHQLNDEQAYELLAEFSRDPKTGVQRSDLLEYTLKYEMHRAVNEDKKFSVVVFDIDNFKDINTELTHVGADDVLHQVATFIRTNDDLLTGDEGSVVRWGGEEFVVMLSNASGDQAHEAAERIRERIAEALSDVRPSGNIVTVSGGVAEYQPDRHQTWKELLADADRHVLDAKSAGKNVIHPPQKQAAA